MFNIEKMDIFPEQPKPCSPEEKELIEAAGEAGKELTKATFHRIPDQIPVKNFRAGLEEILGKNPMIENLVKSSTFRQQTYKSIDRGMNKALEDGIKKGVDLKPIFDEFLKTDIVSEKDMSLSLFIATFEAGMARKSINAWSNQMLGTNLLADAPVIYNGKKMTYYGAYLEFIKGTTQTVLDELKKRCSV